MALFQGNFELFFIVCRTEILLKVGPFVGNHAKRFYMGIDA
jgi:hypothetical protein